MTQYTTVSGDTWDSVAHRTMGNAEEAGALMWANRAYLRLYTFPAGIVLNIPQAEQSQSGSLPPWKQKR